VDIVELSDRFLNLEYLIMAEKVGVPPARLRVTMERGAAFDLDEPDVSVLADRLRKASRRGEEPAGRVDVTDSIRVRDASDAPPPAAGSPPKPPARGRRGR
jgi:hypothetical protein